MDPIPEPASPRQPAADFATTQWSLVLRAGQRGGQEADEALAALCQRYWFPLYAYVRRRVLDVNEAEDLTQEFFTHLLEKQVLGRASPQRGRFRSFLLTALKNFLANERDRAGAHKRGGGRRRLTFDLDAGESRLGLEPAHDLTPERVFEKQWALTLLEVVMERFQQEIAAAGKTRQFALLKGALTGDRHGLPYTAIAAELGMSEEAARQAAHRLRKRYRELLREEVAHTLAEPGEVDEEIRCLFEILGSGA
ncbi:MAG: sigma-70 family RNA polymerase sigma factor [Planctomycetes bacterium]|nr:sigma-70 family RNA polymerase sigma factor [Planctomycetota bacterium]